MAILELREMDSGCLTEVVKKTKKSAMLGTHTIDECFHSFPDFYQTFMSVASITMHKILIHKEVDFISRKMLFTVLKYLFSFLRYSSF